MYRSVDSGLGFSLKPPAWLRNLVSGGVSAAAQADSAVKAVSANYPSGTAPVEAGASNDMPGWVLPLGIGLLAFVLLGKHRR